MFNFYNRSEVALCATGFLFPGGQHIGKKSKIEFPLATRTSYSDVEF